MELGVDFGQWTICRLLFDMELLTTTATKIENQVGCWLVRRFREGGKSSGVLGFNKELK